jgi:hypothetical protein
MTDLYHDNNETEVLMGKRKREIKRKEMKNRKERKPRTHANEQESKW